MERRLLLQTALHHPLQRLVVGCDSPPGLEEVADLAEPVDHELLDQRAAYGDLVQLLEQLVVPLAAAVLCKCRPDRAHMSSGARREAGNHGAAVAVELVDDDLRHEQLDLLLANQCADGSDQALAADVLGGVQQHRRVHEQAQHDQRRYFGCLACRPLTGPIRLPYWTPAGALRARSGRAPAR